MEAIVKINQELANAGSILQDNQGKHSRALAAGADMLTKLQAGVNEITYKQGLDYLGRVKRTHEVMNEARKPITQVLNELAKQFTKLEADLDAAKVDTVPGQIKRALDAYATEKARQQVVEQERIKREQQYKYAIVECKAQFEKEAHAAFTKIVTAQLERIEKLYETATLENFAEVTAELVDMKAKAIEPKDFEGLSASKISIISDSDFEKIRAEVVLNVIEKYNEVLNDHFNSVLSVIIGSFDKRYQTLQEMQELDANKQKELQREIELEAQKRKETERERTNNLQTALEAATEFQKANEALILPFDETQADEAPIAVSYKITVTKPSGWFDLMIYWFEHEGRKLDDEALTKKLGFLTTFAEKANKKTGERVKSEGLIYEPTARAK